jgi:hypothetical protein
MCILSGLYSLMLARPIVEELYEDWKSGTMIHIGFMTIGFGFVIYAFVFLIAAYLIFVSAIQIAISLFYFLPMRRTSALVATAVSIFCFPFGTINAGVLFAWLYLRATPARLNS